MSTDIGVNSTYESLFASSCTSCQVSTDKSAYWTPNLYYQHPNNTFEFVPHDGSVIYYLSRGENRNITNFPRGFQMLSGDKAIRAPNTAGMTWGNATYPPRQISEAVNFVCLSDPIGPETYELPKNSGAICTNGMRAQIHFQTCWNGRDLYKQDNSHVAHTNRIDGGICPPNYPYQLPHIFIETNYAVNQISDFNNGGRYVFSQGDPTGYGFHADFVNGWDPDVLQNAIDNCLSEGDAPFGTIEECPILLKYNSPYARYNCPERPQQIDEPVFGLLDRLPGCVRVTEGPAPATAADMNCGAGVRQPAIHTTVDSTPMPTQATQIGAPYGNSNNVYLGCGNDTIGSSPMRALNAIEYRDSAMTVELCQSYCASRGYRVSGVENGNLCYCDLAVNPSVVYIDSSNATGNVDGCQLTCVGNRNEMCGGDQWINIYNNTDPNFVSTDNMANSVIALTEPPGPFAENYLGCASEGTNGRALNGTIFEDNSMTVEYCRERCTAANYQLYGVEYSTQCFCGNGLASGAGIVDTLADPANSKCNIRCAGKFSEMCGAAGYLNVYNNTEYRPVEVTYGSGRYASQGCLTEPPNARALAGNSTVIDLMTPQKCIKFCLGSGYRYAG